MGINQKLKLGDGSLASASEQPFHLPFPVHERILASGDLAALERLETMCGQLDTISKNGTTAERARARAAKIACDLTRDLLQMIIDTREKLTGK